MSSKKVVTLLWLIALVFFLNILSVFFTKIPYHIVRPSFLILMILAHLVIVKKPVRLFLLCQAFIFFAEYIQYSNVELLNYAIIFFSIGLLILCYLVVSLLKKVKIKYFFLYLGLFFLPFCSVYFIVLDTRVDTFLSFVYGILMIVLLTLVLINYLTNKTRPNKLMLLGIILALFSSAVISINVFEIASDKPMLLIMTISSLLAHLLVSVSFIDRQLESDN